MLESHPPFIRVKRGSGWYSSAGRMDSAGNWWLQANKLGTAEPQVYPTYLQLSFEGWG